MRLFASFINRTIEGVFSSSRLLIAGHLANSFVKQQNGYAIPPSKRTFFRTSHNPTRCKGARKLAVTKEELRKKIEVSSKHGEFRSLSKNGATPR